MITQTNKIDRMPVRTWSWLKVNTADLEVYRAKEDSKGIKIEAEEGIIVQRGLEGISFAIDASKELMNKEMESFLQENAKSGYYIKIPDGYKASKPIKITFLFDEETQVIAEDIVIEAGKESESTIVFAYKSENETTGYHSGRTRVIVQEKANTKLIKAQLLNDESKHNDFFGATVEKGGHLSLLQAEMGSSGANASWNVVLLGEQSSADLDIVYVGEKDKKLDFSSRVEFQGIKGNSNVRIRGILLGNSKKIFRDTLDFVSGSSGSKGREEEDVLMLSKNVRNISVPLLFCGEDDVQGEHAASSGRPNESTLFYLMSRGLSEAQSKKLLAESKFAAILDVISDEELREEILTSLRNSIEKGGE